MAKITSFTLRNNTLTSKSPNATKPSYKYGSLSSNR